MVKGDGVGDGGGRVSTICDERFCFGFGDVFHRQWCLRVELHIIGGVQILTYPRESENTYSVLVPM